MAYANTFMRREVKYMLTSAQLAAIQVAIQPYMQQDAYGVHTIHNVYCDTSDFQMIRRSLEKPVYKEKLRLRSYGAQAENDIVFLELKKKYKGIVYKRRQEMTLHEAENYLWHGILPQDDTQVLREIDATIRRETLRPAVYIAYDRLAYFGRQDAEFRITLDGNIRWRATRPNITDTSATSLVLPNGVALMEIKAAEAIPLWMTKILSAQHLAPTSFSKYGRIYEEMQRQELLQKKEKTICLKVS